MFGEKMKKFKSIIVDYLYIAIGAFIVAVSVNLFLLPLKLSTGGVSGVATILYYIAHIPLSLTVFAINIILFFLAYKKLNKSSLVKTTAGVVFLSLFLEITSIFNIGFNDIFISSVFGGILTGIGIGFTVLRNASTGGSDFAALIINKSFPHISLAKTIFIIDFTIVLISGIVFKNYVITLYSLVSLYISSKVADWILVSGDYAKSVFIISQKNNEIANVILNDMNRGVTGIYSRGYYNRIDSTMLMCIVRSKEIPPLLNKIKDLDTNSFIIISDVRQVHGQGFRSI